ncbi:5-hydroxytryptamine receptor 3A-like [Clupea harengus]|uniref:5-hydroxytryptamine receptor 3A-like n=1 Tax=Clupea harengus TaxID=7950 RepID=A0A8M1KFI8_CLUHA|nr:5-hydroxytryptamine receptor 3A-like [Clupea harengus]
MALNCSEPTTQSLLAAFNANIFNLIDVRPVNHLQTTTNISIYFTLFAILGVTWRIEFLSWDPEECGASAITLPRKKLWMPDVVINEFVDKSKAPDTLYVRVNNTGYVTDGRPVGAKTSCNLNIYTFPFDIQRCSYTFNSYMHSAASVRLSFGKPVEDILKRSMELMETMGEWELLDMSSEKQDLVAKNSGVWDQLTYYITLRRRATLYVVNLIIPSCFLITLDLFSFILPPQSVDRSAFKMTLILGYTVFLLLMNELLPVTGNSIPLLNVFFSICLALMVASLLETIIVTNILHNSKDYRAVPRWVRVLVLEFMARLVCLPQKKTDQVIIFQNQDSIFTVKTKPGAQADEVDTSPAKGPASETVEELRKVRRQVQDLQQQISKNSESDQKTEDWIHIGYVIDRFLFILYGIFISVSFIAIVIIWIHSNSY